MGMLKRSVLLTAMLGLAPMWVVAADNAQLTPERVTVVAAADNAQLTQEARQQTKAFAQALQKTLKQGIQASGPEAAIQLCNTEAPAIAAGLSQNGWQVARTSTKIRNPDNVADDWELQTLEDFSRRMQAGEDPAGIEATTVADGEFRYMKAIPTAPLCLTCHGSQLAPAVTARLDELYPADQARGFNAGDLRGAFTLRKTLEE
jgi:hypothetical protein